MANRLVPIDDLPDNVAGQEVPLDDLPEALPAQRTRPRNPFQGMGLKDIQAAYQKARKAGADDKTLASIADAYVSKEQQRASNSEDYFGQGVLNAADNFARDFARGVPIVGGALDEISAGASALTGGDYQESLDYQRARDRFNEKQFGNLSTATQLAGGVASGLGAARALGLGAQASTAGNAARFMPTTGQALKSAGVAAPLGAADMFARAEGSDRPEAALIGAVLGGGLGFAAPYIAGGVSAGTQRVMDYLKQDANLKKLGISRNAADVLLRQLQADDTLTARGAARIRAGGPSAMLADAGEASANLLDTSLQRSGPGSTAAREAIEQRARIANRGMTGQLDSMLGAPVGVQTRQAGIRAATAADRSSLYDDAYNSIIDYTTPEGADILAKMSRVPPSALAEANALMRAKGEASKQILYSLNDDGTAAITRLPDVRQLDYITRALNDVAYNSQGQGKMGGMTATGAALKDLARDIRTNLRAASPEYGAALDKGADVIGQIQATEFGSTILNPNVTREMVAEELRGLPAAARQAMMKGLRDGIDETLANVKATLGNPDVEPRQLQELIKGLSSKAAREKVEMLVGKEKARAFFGQLGRFSRAVELRQRVAVGSRTFGRTSTDTQVKQQMDNKVVGLLQSGRPIDAVRLAIQKLNRMDPVSRLEAEDKLYGEISKLLTTTRGKNAEKMLRRLQLALRARSQNTAVAARRGADTLGTITGSAAVGSEGIANVD